MLKSTEYKLLNKMLDDAISGEFAESSFDESELSKLQSKLMRYLTSSSMSEKKLREEKEDIEELITNISHQTKTPLTNIMMYSELLGEKADGELKEYANEIHSQSKKLEELITALVKMSRLETGIFRLQPEENTLMSVLKRAYDQALPKAKLKNIELVLHEDTDAKVNLDLKWTAEAVFNIIDNAVKYCDEAGTITVTLTTKKIGKGAVLTVSNDFAGGKGVDYTRFFERFYRGDESHSSAKAGYGIGLSMAEELVRLLKGSINVSYKNGVITFTVTL